MFVCTFVTKTDDKCFLENNYGERLGSDIPRQRNTTVV